MMSGVMILRECDEAAGPSSLHIYMSSSKMKPRILGYE